MQKNNLVQIRIMLIIYLYFSLSASVISLTTLQGLPAASTLPDMLFVTILPEAITVLSPIVTPGIICTPPPIQTL